MMTEPERITNNFHIAATSENNCSVKVSDVKVHPTLSSGKSIPQTERPKQQENCLFLGVNGYIKDASCDNSFRMSIYCDLHAGVLIRYLFL